MSGGHPEIGPELRGLAQAILDRLDPAVRAAAATAADSTRGPGRCRQVWCPVCALAALISGEEHPLLTLIAEHSVALMTVIRAMVTEPGVAGGGSTGPTGNGASGDAEPVNGRDGGNGRYQHIPIVVEPAAD